MACPMFGSRKFFSPRVLLSQTEEIQHQKTRQWGLNFTITKFYDKPRTNIATRTETCLKLELWTQIQVIYHWVSSLKPLSVIYSGIECIQDEFFLITMLVKLIGLPRNLTEVTPHLCTIMRKKKQN